MWRVWAVAHQIFHLLVEQHRLKKADAVRHGRAFWEKVCTQSQDKHLVQLHQRRREGQVEHLLVFVVVGGAHGGLVMPFISKLLRE